MVNNYTNITWLNHAKGGVILKMEQLWDDSQQKLEKGKFD